MVFITSSSELYHSLAQRNNDLVILDATAVPLPELSVISALIMCHKC